MGYAGRVSEEASPDKQQEESLLLFPWMVLFGAVLAVAFIPSPPVNYAALILFYLVFLRFLIVDPSRCLLAFILGLPIISSVQMFAILRGVNSETIVVVVLLIAAAMSRHQQSRPLPPNPYIVPTLFMLLLLTCSMLISFATGSAQYHSWSRGWFKVSLGDMIAILKNSTVYLLMLPIAFRVVWSTERLRSVVYLICIVSIVVGTHTLWDFWAYLVGGDLGGLARATGLVAREPNQFGAYLALMIVLLLPLFLDRSLVRSQRVLLGVTVAVSAAALVTTLSRSSWLALLVGLGYIALFRGARAMSVLIVLALTASFWLPEDVVERIQETAYESEDLAYRGETYYDSSTQKRLARWDALPSQWIEAPFFGHGYMSYGRVWGQIGKSGESRGAHSTLIQLAVEVGLLGLLAYAWFLLNLLRTARRSRGHPDGFVTGLSAGFIPALLCLLVLDLTGDRFFCAPVTVFLWIVGGALGRLAVEARKQGVPADVPPAVAPMARQPVRARAQLTPGWHDVSHGTMLDRGGTE